MSVEETNKRKASADEEVDVAAKVANSVVEANTAWLNGFLGEKLLNATVTMSGPIQWADWTTTSRPIALPQSERDLPVFCGKLLKSHIRCQFGSFELQLIVQALGDITGTMFERIPAIDKFFDDFLAECGGDEKSEKIVMFLKRSLFAGKPLFKNGDVVHFSLRDEVEREERGRAATVERQKKEAEEEAFRKWYAAATAKN